MHAETLRHLIARLKITAEAVMVDHNPNAADDEWARTADHWRVTLKRPGHRMTVYFSMGPALAREPTAADVLESLASDSSGIENASSFEDWCGEYGYDTDSRKAERTYRACERQAENLRRFMAEAYDALLWHTER